MFYQVTDFLRKSATLPPVAIYMFIGDEPLQVADCQSLVRKQFRERGYAERIVFDADINLQWQVVQTEIGTPSLFSQHRIIDIRLQKRSPGNDGAKVLMEFCDQTDPADVVMITIDKLDKKYQQSAWFKAIEQKGIVIQIWPPSYQTLPQWLVSRAKEKGLTISREAAAILAERTEGNLLAADQDLERLALVSDTAEIDVEAFLAGVSDSARHDVFALLDGALAGDPARALRILGGLRAEGTEPVLINWAVTREIRGLYLQSTKNLAAANPRLTASYTTANRRKLLAAALQRHTATQLADLLNCAGAADRIAKGAVAGDPWTALSAIIVWLAGSKRPPTIPAVA